MSAENDPISLIRRTVLPRRWGRWIGVRRGRPARGFFCLFKSPPVAMVSLPIILSTLAEHTQNALGDPRASLLFNRTEGLPRPLTGPRVTLQGSLVATTGQLTRDRYLAKHPEAFECVRFSDFAFFVLVPVSAHLVAGFGAIHWLP